MNMNKFKIYNLGGSCCTRRIENYMGKKIMVKEIDKQIQGVENGYDKFFYEIQHMKKYSDTGFFPSILYEREIGNKYSVGMEYCFNGATLSDLLRNDCVDINYFFNSFDFIMKTIFERIYFVERGEIVNDYIERCYLNRVLNRLGRIYKDKMIEKYGFSDCFSKLLSKGCIINGVFYAPVYKYINYIKNNSNILDKVKVMYSTQCHYDLCPLNIVVDANFSEDRISDFKLIDVRGEGETGITKRHFMYDMGKMLLGLDTFDIFRIFREGGQVFEFHINSNTEVVRIDFVFRENTIYKRYKNAYNHFWDFMEVNNYFADILNEDENSLRLKYLFSQSMMYHPDIPCRIIYEKDESLAILMYMRGMFFIKSFLYEIQGCDPVTGDDQKVDLWPIH